MSGTYLQGDRALERLGDLTELIFKEVKDRGLKDQEKLLLDKLIGHMGEAITERDIEKAKKLILEMLTDVLGYRDARAEFIMNNHLNKNAGWD